MAGKVQLHMDAIAAIVLVLCVSIGFNIYQRFQYSDLLAEHTEVQWRAQDMEVNWNYARGLLENCTKQCGPRDLQRSTDANSTSPDDPQ